MKLEVEIYIEPFFEHLTPRTISFISKKISHRNIISETFFELFFNQNIEPYGIKHPNARVSLEEGSGFILATKKQFIKKKLCTKNAICL